MACIVERKKKERLTSPPVHVGAYASFIDRSWKDRHREYKKRERERTQKERERERHWLAERNCPSISESLS